MEALGAEEVWEEDFQAWDPQVEGSLRWIHMDLEETSVTMADQAVAKTSSLDLEAWVRAVEAEGGIRVEEMEDTEAVGMEVSGGTMIGIVIIMEEAMTEGEVTTEVGGVVIANAGGEVVGAVAGDTEPLTQT